MISYDDFAKIEIKAGKILSAEKVQNADKLLKLLVDFGFKTAVSAVSESILPGISPDTVVIPLAPEKDIRQIISGISQWFPEPSALVEKTCMFVTNLEPRIIRGLQSQGMILALSTPDGKFSLLEPNNAIPIGTKAK